MTWWAWLSDCLLAMGPVMLDVGCMIWAGGCREPSEAKRKADIADLLLG